MPLTQVQQVTATSSGIGGGTLSFSFTQTTEGNLLVIRFVSDSVISTPANWTRIDPYPGGVADVGILARLAPAGTYTSQSVTGATNDMAGVFNEYSGNISSSLANCLDQHTTNDGTKSTGTTGVTAQADELALALIAAGNDNSGTWSAQTNSFVEDADVQSAGGQGTEVTAGFYSKALSATGTQTTSATNAATNANCSGAIATFKAAAAGATGSGLGAFTFTGAGSGVRDTHGAAAGSLAFTGTAAGTRGTSGTAAASFAFTGAGSGAPRTQGAAAAALSFTAAAAGTPTVVGSAAGAFTFTGAASGQAGNLPTEGTGSGTFTFAGAASGEVTVSGQAAAGLVFTGVGTGRRTRIGQLAVLFGFNGEATGQRIVHGVAVGDFAFVGEATAPPPVIQGSGVATATLNDGSTTAVITAGRSSVDVG